MLPTAEQFTGAMRALGLNNSHMIVVYDTAGLFSAPRAWWMFRVFGHKNVAVLDGGLAEWSRLGGTLDSGRKLPGKEVGDFTASEPDSRLLRTLEQVWDALETGSEQVLDARSRPRFLGEQAEPRPGLRSGHMPGARNLPFQQVLEVDRGMLMSPESLRACLQSVEIDPEKPVITSCGSGITACVLALALDRVGVNVAVYDGSRHTIISLVGTMAANIYRTRLAGPDISRVGFTDSGTKPETPCIRNIGCPCHHRSLEGTVQQTSILCQSILRCRLSDRRELRQHDMDAISARTRV
jgi:thiosulfate/3-mercaptopyruvate sulfurtransferase